MAGLKNASLPLQKQSKQPKKSCS